jgi:hypothetical protein
MDGPDAARVCSDRLLTASGGGDGGQFAVQGRDEFAAASGGGDRNCAWLGSQAGDQGGCQAGPAAWIRVAQIGDQCVDRVGEDGVGEVGALPAVLLVRRLGLFLCTATVGGPDGFGTGGALLEQVDVGPGDLEDDLGVALSQ